MPSKRSLLRSTQIYKLLKLPQGFIDDLITLGRSFAECERILNLLQLFLTGFVVHPNESILVPARSIEYLGFVIDSQSMTITLTQKKKTSIKQSMTMSFRKNFLPLGKLRDY